MSYKSSNIVEMAKRIQNPNDDKPLPDCEGPKLHLFQDRKAAIDFRRLLSGADSGSGGHAHVFEVSIRSRIYALKVVWDKLCVL